MGIQTCNSFHEAIAAATSAADLEEGVHGAIGSSGLMEFALDTKIERLLETAAR